MERNEVKVTLCSEGEFQTVCQGKGFGLYQTIGRRDLDECRSRQEDTAYWALLDPDLIATLSPQQIGQRWWSCYQLLDHYCRAKLSGGATAITTVYDGKDSLITANVGDSSAFIAIYDQDGMLVAVQRLNKLLHKPSLSAEKQRISRAGGTLKSHGAQYFLPSTNINYRSYSLLALSRAIGDAEFQGTTPDACIDITNLEELYRKYKLTPETLGVIQIISVSDGFTEPVGKFASSVILLKARQEEWLEDCLTHEDAPEPENEVELARFLAHQAMSQGSADNITISVQTLSTNPFMQGIYDGHVNNQVSRYIAEHVGDVFREQCQLRQEKYIKQFCSVNKRPVTYWRDNKGQDSSFSIQTYQSEVLLRQKSLLDIREQIEGISTKAWEYNRRQSFFISIKEKHRASYAAAIKLYEFMTVLVNKYEDYELEEADFIQCARYVLAANPEVSLSTDNTSWGFSNSYLENVRCGVETLRQHRGWKQFLINLLAACGSLFIGYGVAAIAVGRFSIFKPPTEGGLLLDKLEHEISQRVS